MDKVLLLFNLTLAHQKSCGKMLSSGSVTPVLEYDPYGPAAYP